MRKKLYKIFLIGTMTLALAACGNNKAGYDDGSAGKEAGQEEAAKEENVTKKADTKEPATEAPKMTECQLSQMDSGFYGGIAWAAISDNGTSKKVLINSRLQVVYELPDNMREGDIFNGRAVAFSADQAANPGFQVIGADGKVLYSCSDKLIVSGSSSNSVCNVNFTKDGATIYERDERGLTENKVTACVLNNKYEKTAEIEVPRYSQYTDGLLTANRIYMYLADGVYGCIGGPSDYNSWAILKVRENTAIDIVNRYQKHIDYDIDRCAGLRSFNMAINGDAVDYSSITDGKALDDLLKAEGKSYITEDGSCFNHGYVISTTGMVNEVKGITDISGVKLPDFGVPVTGYKLSNDGKYAALILRGADNKMYYTVIDSDGKKLYEPVTGVSLSNVQSLCVCDGYSFMEDGNGLTAEGKSFKLGDGTAFPKLGQNSVASSRESMESSKNSVRISDGYISLRKKLYKLDGTEVKTVNK